MLQETTKAAIDRSVFEDFLYEEASMLDDWRLDDWFALFSEGSTYHVPTSGGSINDDSATQLFYIADDYVRLRERIVRLNNQEAHAEFPRSIQQHVVTNVRVMGRDGERYTIECNFIVHRSKNRSVQSFFGRSRYLLDCTTPRFRILSKRSHLATDLLYAGKISIII